MSDGKQEITKHVKNMVRLTEDMSLLATMSELYDVHFLLGGDQEILGGVKAILAARSRYVVSHVH